MKWSGEAARRLRDRFGDDVTAFRLVYDTEGCGCAVNGVPALWAVDGPQTGDALVGGEPFALWVDPRQTVFFEETLSISYLTDRQSFRLSSDNQTYTTRLVLADHRTNTAAGSGD